MEEATIAFYGLKDEIARFESNFKKCAKAKRTKFYLEGRLEGLNKLWDNIRESNANIYSLRTNATKEDSYFVEDQFGQIEDRYYALRAEIGEQLEEFRPRIEQHEQPNANSTVIHPHSNNESNAKLPKIALPTFEGSYHTWLSFKNQFMSLIHDNKRLSNVEKQQYLKSCVTGEAERTIQRFQITDANYMVAWNRLNEKYDNQRLLQDTQIETIIDRREIKQETAAELRQLVDVIQESLEALKNLKVETDQWDPFLVVLIRRKLPFKTREEWERELDPKDVPTYKDLIQFLEKRYRTVESLELVGGMPSNWNGNKPQQRSTVNHALNQKTNCLACNNSGHQLMMCDKILNMSVSERTSFVYSKGLCRKCLSSNHVARKCLSRRRCDKCQKDHHTLLHKEESTGSASQEPSYGGYKQETYQNFNANGSKRYQGRTYTTNTTQQKASSHTLNQQPQEAKKSEQSQPTTNLTTMKDSSQVKIENSKTETLFPTAMIKIKARNGAIFQLRALLDQCSEECFVKEDVLKKLGEQQFKIPSFEVIGLNEVITSNINKATKLSMILGNEEMIEFKANVVKTLVGVLPKSVVPWPENLFRNITLADENCATSSSVDIMLGSKIYSEILLGGVIKEGGYLAQNTKLGWIISGKSGEKETPKRALLCLHSKNLDSTDEILKKFWEVEEMPRKEKKQSEEELNCEEEFKKSYRRMKDGRPQVKLPFKENPSQALGESRSQAVARWLAMERKLEKDQGLKKDYMAAIQEYVDLGHMEKVSAEYNKQRVKQFSKDERFDHYYIPHHAVIREESKTTKTRIVFDASAKTPTKKSLNDILMVGPTIQQSIIVRLMNWRKHRYALRGDITKMYRQIKVYNEDLDYQRMVFRFSRTDPIQDFRLNTLTFGTASAPFMAIRTLKQIAIDGEQEYPLAAKVVKTDFHVDDLLTGGDNIEEVKEIWSQVREMLLRAQFPMRKWSSNSNEILRGIPENEREFQTAEIAVDDTLKTLGLDWSPIEDYFFFKIPEFENEEKLTKRIFLSQAARLFDPLGWLGPTVMKPKMMLQRLWKEKLSWDDKISNELAQGWIEFRKELMYLEQIKIRRWFGTRNGCQSELHGCCDASEKAYGAVIYMKTTNETGNSKIELVVAKSRVAPIQVVRLPRLELCGLVLLANLMDITKRELQVDTAYYWTDSSISLHQIQSESDEYKTFVANRIAEIQELTDIKMWRHVSTKDNPADCLSRGLNPKELLEHDLWWHGPSWLKLSKQHWPKNQHVTIPEDKMLEDKKERKSKICKSLTSVNEKQDEELVKIMERSSSFDRLAKATAIFKSWKDKSKPRRVTAKAIEEARIFWVKVEQRVSFKEEIKCLRNGKSISPKSKLRFFSPWLDEQGILRVGGRLQNSKVEQDKREQMIIPSKSTIAKLIVNDSHINTKHGGIQITMVHTRFKYWIVDTRKTVRHHIHRCVICKRWEGKPQQQLMATLPEQRVNYSKVFTHTGVDYAGPTTVLVQRKPGRRVTTKGWVALFVCLCTRAIHIELVSSLKSEDFLAAFKRFISRRGLPSVMYSDNSTTFVGADNEMMENLRIIKEQLEPEMYGIMANKGVDWKFIVPHAPHWGGIWESGIKSMKHHIRRVLGNSVNTFEEITTLLAEIEAVLNSRPLCPLTEDPNDFEVLTPGHFLVGSPLLSPPRPSLLEINPNRLGIYQQLQQKAEEFAERWKNEYIQTLQQRRKWLNQRENVKIGDLVLIIDDDFPPGKWCRGRILEVLPSSDGLVRSVKLKTSTSILTRPITKLILLPIEKTDSPGSSSYALMSKNFEIKVKGVIFSGGKYKWETEVLKTQKRLHEESSKMHKEFVKKEKMNQDRQRQEIVLFNKRYIEERTVGETSGKRRNFLSSSKIIRRKCHDLNEDKVPVKHHLFGQITSTHNQLSN